MIEMPRRSVLLLLKSSLLLPVVAIAGVGSNAFADKISLRGGGQIKGEVVPDPSDPSKVFIYMEKSRVPLRQDKVKLGEIVEEHTLLDDYLPKRKDAPATGEGQYELGLWCDQHKLKELAHYHYEEAVRADPEFGPAHAKLGHLEIGGRWLVGDDIKLAQGLVKVKGKWVTANQKNEKEKEEQLTKEQTSWVRQIRILRDQFFNGADDVRREAESRLMSLDDANAVKPLIKVFNTDEYSSRKLLAHALGAIEGPEAAIALVNGLVNEELVEVRHVFVDELRRRNDPEISKQFVKALKSNIPDYINRSAWGIAALNLNAITPDLVPALTSTKTETVLVGGGGGSSSTITGYGTPNTYGSAMAAYANARLTPQPIAWNGSTMAYLYPPTVGPGVVAYGAGSAPNFTGLSNNFTDPNSMVFGDNSDIGPAATSAGPNRGPVPETVATTVENPEVLTALIKFTGRDFGYDKDEWRAWVKSSFKIDAPALRKVPQP